MQFLKTLFWAAFAVVVVLFAHGNWYPVQLRLWGDLEADVKLPVLVFAAFLIGFLPTFALYRARLWSMRRRIETHERNLVNAQITGAPAAPSGAPPPAPASTTTLEGLS
jgi:lipopolysaccharide assembly protein A